MIQTDKEYYKKLRSSILFFIAETWKLVPQPVKPEFKKKLDDIINNTHTHEEWEERKIEVEANWFGDYDYEENKWYWIDFEKGKHITWQQYLILVGVEKAVKGEAKKMISVASGRGIGKSATLSWIMIWFLFCFPDCQIPCTAPTSDQMFDVLWKEVALWIHRLPEGVKAFYDWESSHVRIKESPYTWFARAKTASKENPEALSGVHADYVMAMVDEASAVNNEIFEAAQGIFSTDNAYFIMISNYTRLTGFFHDSQTRKKYDWQAFRFSSEDSPVVDSELVVRYADEGRDTDKFRTNILGLPPRADSIDEKSYLQLIAEKDLVFISPELFKPLSALSLGIDPAGEGDNETAYGIRDRFMAQILGTEKVSSAIGVAMMIMSIADKWKIYPRNVVIDSLGPGADVAKELALASRWNVRTVNVAETPDRERDKEMFSNKRAEMYWKMKVWIENGGMFVENKKLKDQLLSIRFRRSIKGKIEIMPKRIMRSQGLASPDLADALAMTFLYEPHDQAVFEEEKQRESMDFDRFAVY